MNESGSVTSSVADGVAQVEFGHPKSNSLPSWLLRGIAEEISSVGVREDVRVVVIRSGGTGAFCAGASFDELSAIADEVEGKEFFMGFARVILAMTRCPRPVIARVHGKAVGGGVGVVAAADYAMATSGAAVRLSELAVGIGPFVVGPVIERKIGHGRLAALSIDADWRDAAWAERHGLFARVVENTEALDAALGEFTQKLVSSNPEALAQIKRITWNGTDDWPRLLEERAALSGRLVLSRFAREAIQAAKTPRR
jgi:methylglutaconyl-CoA hydratase